VRDTNASRFEMQADDFVIISKKYDPNQPRDEEGQWTKGVGQTGRQFTSEEGYEWHEKGPVAEWAKQLPYADTQEIENYAGFGYHSINDLRRGTYTVPTKDYFVRAATPEEMRRMGWDVERNEWIPSVKVKEGEFKPGYPVDPRDVITPESIARFGHPIGKNKPSDYHPDDPRNRVDDGRIVINQYFRPVPGGPAMMFSIQRVGPDLEQLRQVQAHADALDDLIANRGYELPEAITVERGAYLPGVTIEQLRDMAETGVEWEEKGFTSTMVGDAGGRAKSYPALGKFESIYNRYPGQPISAHQDEVGTAVRFHITIPAGTKVAPVEAVRRLEYEFPRIPNPEARPADVEEKHWTMRDFSATPVVDAKNLQQKESRTESEVLLASGARFKVMTVKKGELYRSGDGSLKPVQVVEVYLEYIGGKA